MKISSIRVFDPRHGIDGQVRDLLVSGNHIINTLPPGTCPRNIDGRGLIAMPGGVDVHCHIASSSVNRARAMQGEEHATHVHAAAPEHNLRSGSGILTPSTFVTGYRYAALGYTTALEAAVSPSGARQTHLELDDTPNLDAGFLLLLANHEQIITLLDRQDEAAAIAMIQQMLHRTGAMGIKVVNPGGVAAWRREPQQHTIQTLDDRIAGTSVTPRRLLQAMATAAEQLGLAHPPHVHCNRLGIAGNVETTLATLDALAGRRVHLTHLQFHAYGASRQGEPTSAAARLCDYLADHPEVTADVGQVVFGSALTLTGDTPLEYLLWQLVGRRYVNVEGEMEAGCGLMPLNYSDRTYLHSLQWAIGLELMLACRNPWQMMLSTDHPNGGSFLTYPAIIAALMNRDIRAEQIAKAHPRAMRRSPLRDIDRQMTLQEVAIITRAAPARILGLDRKGHLGAGADADITLYHDKPHDPEAMFAAPRYVIKAGQIVVEDGELRPAVQGARLRADVPANEQGQRELADWFARRGSYHVSQFGMHPHELADATTVPGSTAP